jgi:hypothetical protein
MLGSLHLAEGLNQAGYGSPRFLIRYKCHQFRAFLDEFAVALKLLEVARAIRYWLHYGSVGRLGRQVALLADASSSQLP